MTDEPTNTHGGARRSAGRPRGSSNRLPSKSAVLRERLVDLVEPELAAIFRELYRIALSGTREADRLKAIDMLLTQALGKPTETLQVIDATAGATAEDLLNAWREAQS